MVERAASVNVGPDVEHLIMICVSGRRGSGW